MKKERFFRLLGDLDDAILEKYRQMDAQLSRKAHQKKRTLRILAVAACLCLLIGACVPVGMMAHPAGRAILKGDSEVLIINYNCVEYTCSSSCCLNIFESYTRNLPRPCCRSISLDINCNPC